MKWLGRFVLITFALCAYSTQSEATNFSSIIPEKCLDANGAACRVEIYEAGTSTPYTVYTNQARSAGATTVVTADSNGFFADYYCDPSDTMKFIVTDNGDTEVFITRDDVDCPLGASETSDVLAALGLNGSAASASLGTSGDVLCKVNANCVVSGTWEFTTAPSFSSTSAGATEAPTLEVYRNSASPAASDVLGGISFTGEDSGGNKVNAYGRFNVKITDPTDTTEDGEPCIWAMVAGTETEIACFGASGLDVKTGNVLRSGTNVITEFAATEVAFNDDASLTFAHGLSCTPDVVFTYLVNTSADLNYSAGDRVIVGGGQTQNADSTINTVTDGTNITLHVGVDFKLLDSSTFNKGTINESNWNLDVYAQCLNV